jgi:hypothetical protein
VAQLLLLLAREVLPVLLVVVLAVRVVLHHLALIVVRQVARGLPQEVGRLAALDQVVLLIVLEAEVKDPMVQ